MNASPNPHSTRTVSLLGTPLLITGYSGLLRLLPEWVRRSGTTAVDFCNTQTLAMRRIDPAFLEASQDFDYFLPDGMPLVWNLRAMGVTMHDRVYGPAFMRHALGQEARLSHYFLGGSETTLRKLVEQARILSTDRIRIVGTRHGYFSATDNSSIIEEINRLSPDLIWIGLGTPKQQQWVHDHRHLIRHGVLLTVGFAFDVNAGTKRDAPLWMQKFGLTWIFRLSQEPGRLLGRYLKYNTTFLALILLDLTRHSLKTISRPKAPLA